MRHLSALLLLALPVSLAAQTATISGRLLDAESRAPINAATITLVATGVRTATDADGHFRFDGVAPGRQVLRIRHLAYGTHEDSLTVAARSETELVLLVSPQAIELEPVRVVAREDPASGRRSNLITREQIEAVTAVARHLGDVVKAYIPGATLREFSNGGFCLEFRGAAGARFQSSCNTPLIVVDDVPISHPTLYLRDTPPEEIESIEYVPSSEAGARYGLGSQFGVLVIRTRRAAHPQSPVAAPPSRFPAYPWTVERGRYPWPRAWIASAVGNAAGLALGLAALGCISGGVDGDCVASHETPGGYAALALPALGAAAGARLFGATRGSVGRPLLALAGTAVPLVLGFAMYTEGMRHGFAGSRRVGAFLMLVGAPAGATAADALFRHPREPGLR